MKKLLIYLPELFADWEGAFLLPELAQHKIPYVIVSDSTEEIYSIGRLKVKPEASINDFSTEEISGLILIGSDSWPDKTKNRSALKLAENLLKNKILVAGICGATFALAQAGIFNERKHTSNSLAMLKYFAPKYEDESHYIEKLAVTDQNLITASGSAPVEFAFEILKALQIYTDEKRQIWFEMFKNGVNPPDDFWS